MIWLAVQSQDFRAEVQAEKRRGRVLIRFKRFSELRGTLHRGMLSVAVIKYGLRWKVVFDRDSLPLATDDRRGFYCGFCDERKVFKTREDLWADHLFEPFRSWMVGDTSILNDKLAEANLQGFRDHRQLIQADVPLAMLKLRNVGLRK